MKLYTMLLEQKRKPVLKTILNGIKGIVFYRNPNRYDKKTKQGVHTWKVLRKKLKLLLKYIFSKKKGSRRTKKEYINYISNYDFDMAMVLFTKYLNPFYMDIYNSPLNIYTVHSCMDIPDNTDPGELYRLEFRIIWILKDKDGGKGE